MNFPLPGGYAEDLGWPPRRYDQHELRKGIEHELEHTDSIEIARQIAMDHLAEQVMEGKPQDYYTRLQEMEANRSKEDLYREWKELINLTADELESFLETPEGKVAGLSREEARRQGIGSGQESAKWIIRMKRTPVQEWTWKMWDWAQRQLSFVKRMSGMKGPLFKDGKPTRKLLSLLVWGHAPESVLSTLRDDQPATRRPGKAFAANAFAMGRSDSPTVGEQWNYLVHHRDPAHAPPWFHDQDDEEHASDAALERFAIRQLATHHGFELRKPTRRERWMIRRIEDWLEENVDQVEEEEEAEIWRLTEMARAGAVPALEQVEVFHNAVHLSPNRARHPFRSVDVEQALTARTSAAHPDYDKRYRRRYVVAGIDAKGNDWSLGTFDDLEQARGRAKTQRIYPEAVVIDVHTGSVLFQAS